MGDGTVELCSMRYLALISAVVHSFIFSRSFLLRWMRKLSGGTLDKLTGLVDYTT